MLSRNELVHAVFWPLEAKKSVISLADADGVFQASFEITAPLKGADLAKLMPLNGLVLASNCYAFSLSGEILVTTHVDFETVVVTERAVIDTEERLARLERRELRRERRTALELQELARLREQEKRRAGPELIEPSPEPVPGPAPEPVPGPAPEPVPGPAPDPSPEVKPDA